MALTQLKNYASADGLYNDLPTDIRSMPDTIVWLVDGLTISMSAQFSMWADMRENTYTITIDNATDLNYEAPITITTDAFDTNAVDLVENSVTVVSGSTLDSYTFVNGVLTILLDGDIEESSSAVITFRLEKVVTP